MTRRSVVGAIRARRTSWRNVKHTVSWSQTLEKYAFPVLGAMRVDQIERQDVLRVLKPIWKSKSETARRVRHRIGAVLSWCQAQGFLDVNMAGEVIAGALPSMRASQPHFKALPYEEMAQVLRTIEDDVGSPNVKLCLRFTVLTATRGKEAREARWEEMNLKKRIWCIPALRTKTSAEHKQPLSRAALAVLERARALDDGSGLVFPSPRRRGKPFSDVAMMVVVKRNGLGDRMTMHGCRATFRTWASECTDADHAVMEMSLGHLVGTEVVRIYDRSELLAKRRALMEQWGSYVTSPDAVSGSDEERVVPDAAPAASKKRGARARASAKDLAAPVLPPLMERDPPEPVALALRLRTRGEPLARESAMRQLGLFGDPTET